MNNYRVWYALEDFNEAQETIYKFEHRAEDIYKTIYPDGGLTKYSYAENFDIVRDNEGRIICSIAFDIGNDGDTDYRYFRFPFECMNAETPEDMLKIYWGWKDAEDAKAKKREEEKKKYWEEFRRKETEKKEHAEYERLKQKFENGSANLT